MPLVYPAFQFERERVLPGLAEVLQCFGDGAEEWTVAAWLVSPSRSLGGRSPVEWLRDGRDRAPRARARSRDGGPLRPVTRPRDEAPGLAPPPAEPGALAGFPASAAGPERALYRRRARGVGGPGGSRAESLRGPGRFDLPPPHGTCYLAGDPLSALLEVVGPDLVRGAVWTPFLAERRVCELRPPRRVRARRP